MELDFQKHDGLIPVVTQDHKSNEILMLAFINEDAFQKSVETGKAHYYSRTKKRLWMKGESSGHVQEIKEILVDCDEDSLVFKVHQIGGAACHTGYNSCFYRKLENHQPIMIKTEKVFDPKQVYQTSKE